MQADKAPSSIAPAKRYGARERLLETTIEILNEVGEAGLRVEDVLQRSGAARGSLYYHFDNLQDLIDEAQVARFSMTSMQRTELFASDLARVQTRAEFIRLIERWIEQLFNPAPEFRRLRLARADALGSGYVRQEIATAMGASIVGPHRRLAELLDAARDKGFIDPECDTFGFAMVFDGVLFSRVLVELCPDADLQARWNRMARQALLSLLFGDDWRRIVAEVG